MNEYTKFDLGSEIFSWIKTIIYAVISALFITHVVIVNAEVPSGSMENTIMTDDRIVAFRQAYLFDEPQRYDIVVFRYPDDEKTLFVKRIIGLPGETVEIRNGLVYVNNDPVPLDDEYTKEEMNGDFGPFIVPEESYFMLGDNRNNSKDSRYWVNKYVERDKILGKVIFRYYPGFKKY